MTQPRIDIPMEKIQEFCRKWKVTEFALFGSVLRDDFRPDSDIDVLVTFASDAHWGWKIIDMRDELSEVIGRPVDLVEKSAIEHSANPFRREAILMSAEVILHAAA